MFTWSRTPSVTSTRTVPTPPCTCPVAWWPPTHHEQSAVRCAPIRRVIRTWNSGTIERLRPSASDVAGNASRGGRNSGLPWAKPPPGTCNFRGPHFMQSPYPRHTQLGTYSSKPAHRSWIFLSWLQEIKQRRDRQAQHRTPPNQVARIDLADVERVNVRHKLVSVLKI